MDDVRKTETDKVENIKLSVDFLNDAENQASRRLLANNQPRLANAIAHYEKDALDVQNNEKISNENKSKILDSMRGIHAYHIRIYGPEYYGAIAESEKAPYSAIAAEHAKTSSVIGNSAILAETYLDNIQDAAKRSALKKEHEELKIPVEGYEAVSNGLANIQMPANKKEQLLHNLADHYADRIKDRDANPIGNADAVYAITYYYAAMEKRNAESAQYFKENIDDWVHRNNQLPPESHKELMGAYYQYVKEISQSHDTEKTKELIAAQIRDKSPESFSYPAVSEVQAPEHAH